MTFFIPGKRSVSAALACLLIALVPVLSAPTAPCGRDNQPACSADPPNKPWPYCTEAGVHAGYSASNKDLSGYDKIRALKGWCWKIDPECGTAPGKPCCPNGYHQSWEPSLPMTLCSTSKIQTTPGGPTLDRPMYCKANNSLPPTKMYKNGDATMAYRAGTCVANKPNCGEIGKTCCYIQGASNDAIICRKGECQVNSEDPADWRCVSK